MSQRHRFSIGIDANTSRCRTCGVYRRRHRKSTVRAMRRGDDYSLVAMYAPSEKPEEWQTAAIPCRTREGPMVDEQMKTEPTYTVLDEYMRLLEWSEAGQGNLRSRSFWRAARAGAAIIPEKFLAETVGHMLKAFAGARGEDIETARERIRNERVPEEFAPECPGTIDMNAIGELVEEFEDWADESGAGGKDIEPTGKRERKCFEAGKEKAYREVAAMLRGAFLAE